MSAERLPGLWPSSDRLTVAMGVLLCAVWFTGDPVFLWRLGLRRELDCRPGIEWLGWEPVWRRARKRDHA